MNNSSSKKNPLHEGVQFLKGIGPKRAEALAASGIVTVHDLLFYFPARHLDRTSLLTAEKAFNYVAAGYEGEITVIGTVLESESRYYRKKEIFKVIMEDDSGIFELVWFQGAKYYKDKFEPGQNYAVSGKPKVSKIGSLQFAHPDFDHITEHESHTFFNTNKIIPFYRIPQGLKSKNISDVSFRRIIFEALDLYSGFIRETLPEYLLRKHSLQPIAETVRNMHFPDNGDSLTAAYERLAFEELFYFELLTALRKYKHKTVLKTAPIRSNEPLIEQFTASLPFKLTNAQQRVVQEIAADMKSGKPMNRLLQGDVGSGKTVTALIAALLAYGSGKQSVFMAPTEILAFQHASTLQKLLQPFNEGKQANEIQIALLTGSTTAKARRSILEHIRQGNAHIIVGTHALIEESVLFSDIGLAVIDEQQRFGVKQRAKLIGKGSAPHILVMSATPIPRTLSMTLYGDLDVSVIDELPAHKKPVQTHLMSEERLQAIYRRLAERAEEGTQSFIVFPLVAESEKLDLKSAETSYRDLKLTHFKDIPAGIVHGKMSWEEKEEAMRAFRDKEIMILISTTVIEVGIDIPDANLMVIMEAHRFGLSQLHQLRGRVGRGGGEAHCILVTKKEIAAAAETIKTPVEFMSPSALEKYKSSVRLNAMTQHSSGFDIAEIDLRLRGSGNIYGLQQSGLPVLKYADLINDIALLKKARKEAFGLIHKDPRFEKPEHTVVKKIIKSHYSDSLRYAGIA